MTLQDLRQSGCVSRFRSRGSRRDHGLLPERPCRSKNAPKIDSFQIAGGLFLPRPNSESLINSTAE